MKKLIKLSAVLAGLTISSTVFAQVDYVTGSMESSGSVTNAACPVLATSANITLSTGSKLAYKCASTYNQIVIQTCNTAGSRTPATVDCAFTADDTVETFRTVTDSSGATVDILGYWNDSSCTNETNEDGTKQQFDIAGGRYYTMTSSGGGIAESGGAATDTCDGETMASNM